MPMRYTTRRYKSPIIKGKDLRNMNWGDTKTLLDSLEENKNFENMDLSNLVFDEINLTNAIFKDAMLNDTSLHESILRGANFENVNYEEGDLTRADLTGANLSGADFININFKDTIVTDINSSDINFYNAKMVNTNFEDSTLLETGFDQSTLTNVNLKNTNLTNVMFESSNCERTDFTGANMTNAYLENTNFSGAKFVGANLSNARIQDVKITNADFTGANLSGARLWTSTLRDAILTGANLTGANIDSNMQNMNLQNMNLTNAVLRNVNLQGAQLQGAQLQGAQLQGAQLQGANLTGANLTGAFLVDANLTDAIGVNLEGANLEDASSEERNPGVAYEIHNQFNFDFDFDKFMEIIRKYNDEHSGNKSAHSSASPPSKSDEATPNINEDEEAREITRQLLKPLIDYPDYTRKRKVLKQLNIAYEDRDEDAIQDTIIFVLLQSPKFVKQYIDGFTNDCVFAYSSGRRTSCIKGQYERIFLNIKTTIQTLCLESDGLKSDCKEVFKELYGCFLPDNVDKIMSEWWDSQTDLDDYLESEKKEFIKRKSTEFKQYFISKYSEKFEGSIDKYIKKTFTVAYFDSIIGKPKTPTPVEAQVNIRYSGENYNFMVVPNVTTIGELKGKLLQKLIEDSKIQDANHNVNFIFLGKRYGNDKNAETVSSVIGTNYAAVFNALLTSATGMGKTKNKKKRQTKKKRRQTKKK
jgi:uncharacterized protein YjbI with pentapeptide repeats